jgi:hypothetical protein
MWMKRTVLAILCSAVVLAHAGGAIADPVFDQDMASRYMRAAQSGDDEAQFYLGSLYAAGVGVPRSDEEAFRWLGRAASQGHSHAMLILAGLYATGRGVEKNNIEAYKWAYIVGGASRVEEFRNGSRQLMSVLEGRMSPEEINRAKTAASQWRAAPVTRPAPTASSNDFSRNAPLVRATPAPTVATAAPAAAIQAPAAPASSPQPAAKTLSDNSSSIDALVKKGDVNSFLKEVPGLRKKFGF